jgi:hypothetical protein
MEPVVNLPRCILHELGPLQEQILLPARPPDPATRVEHAVIGP